MVKRGFRARVVRAAVAIAVGGTAFQFSGCDSEVRSTLIAGLQTTAQGLSSALISAFFVSLQDDDAASSGLTTTSP